jgi:2'-5' RNA ligase
MRAAHAKAVPGLRAFVALEPDSPSLRRLARVSEHLRLASGAPSASWVPPARMHVTLLFVAALASESVDPLAQALRSLAAGRSAPDLGGLKLEAFPSLASAEVAIAEVADPQKDVAKLAAAVNAHAGSLGIPVDARPFRPHVTLARLKRAYDARRWLRPGVADVVGECRAGRLTLFQSVLTERGAEYTSLAGFDFVDR